MISLSSRDIGHLKNENNMYAKKHYICFHLDMNMYTYINFTHFLYKFA